MTSRVADLTLEELESMIETIVERKLHESRLSELFTEENHEDDEILEWLDHNMWIPPVGGKSSLDYLREDRDR